MAKNDEYLKRELARLLLEKDYRQQYHRIDMFFPKTGPFSRTKYAKHLKFMAAGKNFRQRAIVAANRTGKTVMGAYEMACHLTGLYPDFWEGRVFTRGVSAWAASISNEATKNIIQQELLGSPMDPGSGMIPKKCIKRIIKKPGVADAVETVYVQHTSGELSRLDFKSYEQGRDTFQGTKKQVVWLDEEPTDYGIFSECLTRTAGGEGEEGMIYCTFTPLFGLSETVLSFLPDGKMPEGGVDPAAPHKYVAQVTWEEVPHLSEEWKKEALASYTVHERDARSRGTPALGAGAIYPYPEDEIAVEPFKIPAWWSKVYGMDVGWNRTAVIWGAIDPSSQQIYLYSEHYVGKETPPVHASAIKSRGDWIEGVVDPRADSRNQTDGKRLIDLYEDEGLLLSPADNSKEAGLYKTGQLLVSGQLKVFNTLRNWLSEYRVYRRDVNGKVVKKNDHLMDATRYLIMSGIEIAAPFPDPDVLRSDFSSSHGKSDITGY